MAESLVCPTCHKASKVELPDDPNLKVAARCPKCREWSLVERGSIRPLSAEELAQLDSEMMETVVDDVISLLVGGEAISHCPYCHDTVPIKHVSGIAIERSGAVMPDDGTEDRGLYLCRACGNIAVMVRNRVVALSDEQIAQLKTTFFWPELSRRQEMVLQHLRAKMN